METDITSSPILAPPTPSETTQQTSVFSASRKSSGRATPSSPLTATTPLGTAATQQISTNGAEQEEDEAPLDPRRLTPNLHANLVSEILSLRREVEAKDNQIDRLEGDLAESKGENDQLQNELVKKSKETKAIKLQLQSIEDGTLTALEDLSRERDQALESSAENKKRFDESQRQLKTEAEKNDRLHKEWETEKSRWAMEKNQLQRKHDIAETRLKAIVEQLSLEQADPNELSTQSRDFGATEGVGPMHSSPVKVKSHLRNRSSVSTIGSMRPDSFANGPNLADELANDDDGTHSEADAVETHSWRSSKDFGRNETEKQDLSINREPASLPEINEKGESSPDEISEFLVRSPVVNGADGSASGLANHSGVTYSSGGQEAVINESAMLHSVINARPDIIEDDSFQELIASNREISTKYDLAEPLPTSSEGQDVQSYDRPQSGPMYKLISMYNSLANERRKSGETNIPDITSTSAFQEQFKPRMSSSSTQTDGTKESETVDVSTPASSRPTSIQIPEISIHPPQSAPHSPAEAAFIPNTKDAATQTPMAMLWNSRSTAVQTDIIRVDRRQFKLPAHLLPSALNQTVAHESNNQNIGSQTQTSLAPENNSVRGIDFQTTDKTPSFDSFDADANSESWQPPQRNLTYNGKQPRNSEGDPFEGVEDPSISEMEYAIPTLSKPTRRMQKLGKHFDPPTPVPENEKVTTIQQPPHNYAQASAGSRTSFDRTSMNTRTNAFSTSSKSKDMRSERSATPTSIASSSAWSKATSVPSGLVIPTRTSSVGVRSRRTDGTSSPPFRSGASSPTKPRDGKRVGKKPPLRKARSASLATSESRGEAQRYPVSPFSQTSFASGETSPPPVPENSILQVFRSATHQRSSSSQTRRLSAIYPTGNASVGTSIQHSVVDAIAATMVGEWMWKYVRRRKGFGAAETSQDSVRASDQRHRRWVWLSPWERTLMWSSKQPTTNAALLGKVGRKVTIQSVLDVKDDNLSIRQSPNAFNRSILVLTPSRAIKFTADSRERHYLWLTALSFLAHHTSQGDIDLSFLPKNATTGPVGDDIEADISRNTSATASRNGRKPWSSRVTNRSQQSSGYATPSVPDASTSNQADPPGVPPRPTRPAPQVPPGENLPSDSALAPLVPRIPGGTSNIHNKDIFGVPAKHTRNRSASTTGVVSSSRPDTRKSQNRAPSTKGYPHTGATNSSNHSTKSNIDIPVGQQPNVPLPYPLPTTTAVGTAAPQIGSSTQTKHFGLAANQSQPQLQSSVTPELNQRAVTGVQNDGTVNSAPDNPINFTTSPSGVRRLNQSDAIDTEFGGNSRFFDAVGGPFGSPPSTAGTAEENALPLGASSAPPPPMRAAPQPPSGGMPTNYRHLSGESFDSVAPPPIQRWPQPQSQTSNRELSAKVSQPTFQGQTIDGYVSYPSGKEYYDVPTKQVSQVQLKDASDAKRNKASGGRRGFLGFGRSTKSASALNSGVTVS